MSEIMRLSHDGRGAEMRWFVYEVGCGPFSDEIVPMRHLSSLRQSS